MENRAIIDKTRQDKTRQDYYSAFYTDSFYKINRSDKNYISAQKVIKLVQKYLPFESVIDIGCGSGQFLRVCAENGVKNIRGVDGPWVKNEMLLIPPENFTQFELSQKGLAEKITPKKFDLTISSEVAEHIEAEYAENFVNNITDFSDVVLFSAAIPGQTGTHHVNEQWPSYWIEKFAARGFIPVDCIRQQIWDDKDIHFWYRQNLLFFVRENSLKKFPQLEAEANRPVCDVVHSEVWEGRISYYKHLFRTDRERISDMGPRELIKNMLMCMMFFTPAVLRAIKKRIKK